MFQIYARIESKVLKFERASFYEIQRKQHTLPGECNTPNNGSLSSLGSCRMWQGNLLFGNESFRPKWYAWLVGSWRYVIGITKFVGSVLEIISIHVNLFWSQPYATHTIFMKISYNLVASGVIWGGRGGGSLNIQMPFSRHVLAVKLLTSRLQ